MDFEYTEEQRLLAETLRRFLATGYSFEARAKIVSSASGMSEDVWAALAELGVLGVPFAAELGGFGGTTVDMMAVMETLGAARIDRMRERIATLLSLKPEDVSVNASTGNLSGAEGGGRAISATALVSVVKA